MRMRIGRIISEAVRREAFSVLKRTGLLNQIRVGKNSSGYSSGEPEIMLPRATTAAPALIPIPVLPGAPLAASDKHVIIDIGGQLVAFRVGTVAEALALSLTASDSSLWRGVGWVKAGATNTAATANTEQTVSSTTFTTKKRFLMERPGRYRVSFDLKRTTSDSAEARLVILSGATPDVIVVSSTETTSSATYVAKTLDMNADSFGPFELAAQIRNTGSGSAEIQNVVVKYDVATANPTLAATVLQD